jgi:hypothetical protein
MKIIMKASFLDIFGKKINLFFDKDRDTHNTPYGILMSIMIYTIVVLYSGVRTNVLLNYYQSNVSSVNQPINIINDLGKVYINET